MSNNQDLLVQLRKLIKRKKSKQFYADKLGVTEFKVYELLKELKTGNLSKKEEIEIDRIIKFEENLQEGTGELTFNSREEIKTLDELIDKCKIDITKWDITKYVQNFWGNDDQPHWQVKAWLSKKSTEQVFQDAFVDFLNSYTPTDKTVDGPEFMSSKSNAMLVINKQDAHLNKYDIDGDNNIADRLYNLQYKIETIAAQSGLSNNIDDITYIIGSDEFNSEYSGATTKGTPQTNTHSFHHSFEFICEHEISMIWMLLKYCNNLNVVYVSGNHDEYVGWHLVTWLKSYFRNTKRVTFDCSPKYRKYVSYGTSAMMFNHGDAIKPVKLAGIFPIEFREGWSEHTNFYIFTGDKHHEISHDFNGIKFYQIPAFNKVKGLWEDKLGHVMSKGEVTGFLIDELDGMTNIFKQYL